MTLGSGIARTPLPLGFNAGGVNCGVRRHRPDLGIIISDEPAVAAGVFTQNRFAGAAVTYCQAILPSESVRAIITNSGQANAGLGSEGEKANGEMAFEVAKALGCYPRQVLTASTGVIGQPLDLKKILPAISHLVDYVDETAEGFALAILTTDLIPKTVTTTVTLSGGDVRITGICKGSGMIHPNMATMLGYLLTDVEMSPTQAQKFLKNAVDVSFNMISVDGETSTNDSVFLLANGASKVALTTVDDEQTFYAALEQMSIVLAQSIAADGEGAGKLLEVRVTGARSASAARIAARSLTASPLIKTALNGEDPNWGRILARLGADHASSEDFTKLEVSVQSEKLFSCGRALPFDRDHVRSLMKKSKVQIDIELNSGDAVATAWGCDLSKKYIEINSEYA